MIDFLTVTRIKRAIEEGLRVREGKVLDDEVIRERANNIAIAVAEELADFVNEGAAMVCTPDGCTPTKGSDP